MSTNIYDLANQLERSIRLLPEYKAVEEAKQAIEADADAKAVFLYLLTDVRHPFLQV